MLRRFRGLSADLSGVLPGYPAGVCDSQLASPILIRHSRADDHAALERLAALDSRALPDGTFLLAEVDGELVAAAPLDVHDEPVSNPFRPTACLRELLTLRAGHIRLSRGRFGRSGSGVSVASSASSHQPGKELP